MKKRKTRAQRSRSFRCPHCGAAMILRPASEIYHDVKSDRKLYVCHNYSACNTYVAAHPNTDKPMGVPANGDLRNLRMAMCEREFGCRAVAPHAYLPYLLDDSNPEERALALSFGASLLALCDRLVIYGDRISSGMKEEIRRARELGIPILNRQTQLSDGSSDPVIVGRYINGISLNGLEYLKNDADEVIYFAGVEAAKVYLREHGVTEDEMEDMVFRKSVGTCFRCGDPLFLSDIPEYTCQCFRCDEDFYSIEQDVDLNGNVPYFTESELTDQSYEYYSDLDALGRCGTACASIGQDLMPTESRGSIGMVKPTGWHTVRYDDLVDGKYLYNRCHLIGFQLTGENANTKNLITGTRYLNIEGMLPFENMVADYVKENGNHVMYRVTPIFEGDNLLANGVLMEGYSVEDKGAGVSYCVFAYNVQPGIEIDYATGESKLADSAQQEEQKTATVTPTPSPVPEKQEPATGSEASQADYILNTNTKKFHYPTCSSVNDMKEKNKQEFFGTRDEAISNGYSPCGRCKP